MNNWMGGVGFLFAIVYLAVVVCVVSIALVSLWRGMRAQERMAETLGRVEAILARSTPPAE